MTAFSMMNHFRRPLMPEHRDGQGQTLRSNGRSVTTQTASPQQHSGQYSKPWNLQGSME